MCVPNQALASRPHHLQRTSYSAHPPCSASTSAGSADIANQRASRRLRSRRAPRGTGGACGKPSGRRPPAPRQPATSSPTTRRPRRPPPPPRCLPPLRSTPTHKQPSEFSHTSPQAFQSVFRNLKKTRQQNVMSGTRCKNEWKARRRSSHPCPEVPILHHTCNIATQHTSSTVFRSD